MMTSTKLNDLLDNADVYIDEQFIVFRAPNSDAGREVLLSLKKELVLLAFKSAEISDDELEVEDGFLTLVVDTSTDSWGKRCPLYFSEQHFWDTVDADDDMPGFYFICDEKIGSWQDSDNLYKYKAYFAWKNVFRLLADHRGTSSSPGMLVYFVSKEKGAKIYEVNPTVTLDELNSMGFCSSSYKAACELKDLIEVKDAHARERKDVLRTTLSELLDEDHKESSFKFVVSQFKRYQKKYDENYDVYVHQFSVNKLLCEIEEKVSDYISKINESISSSQNKAFAIPGALIAVGALIKNQGFWSVVLVCVGLYFVMLLTRTANSVYLEAFKTLKEQVRKSLSRYEIIKDEDEVRVSAEDAKDKLMDLIVRAEERVRIIDRLAAGMFFCGLVYGLAVVLENNFSEQIKASFEWVLVFINAQPYFDRFKWVETLPSGFGGLI